MPEPNYDQIEAELADAHRRIAELEALSEQFIEFMDLVQQQFDMWRAAFIESNKNIHSMIDAQVDLAEVMISMLGTNAVRFLPAPPIAVIHALADEHRTQGAQNKPDFSNL